MQRKLVEHTPSQIIWNVALALGYTTERLGAKILKWDGGNTRNKLSYSIQMVEESELFTLKSAIRFAVKSEMNHA
jgi:hypothetical protein